VPSIAAIALWISKGMWIPFAVWFPIQTLLGVFLAKHHFNDAAFICAECNSVCKPTFKNVLFTSGTTKARWLTCSVCNHAGYCVETIHESEAN
jgi:hypothetical protein